MQTLKEPRTSGTQTKGKEKLPNCGTSASGPKLSKSKGPSQSPGKHQRLSRGTPEGELAKETKADWATELCQGCWGGPPDGYHLWHLPKDPSLQGKTCKHPAGDWWTWERAPWKGFTPQLIDIYWSKWAAIMVCQDQETRDWLGSKGPNLKAWKCTRLKMVRLVALPT